MARSIVGPITAIALLAYGASAGAAPEAEALKPRYAVEATRLEAAPSHDTVDGRYRLDARLRPDDAPQTAGGMTLSAKLVAATSTACDAAGVIFANSFE